ncbi:MAG: fused MFS/spermidine synthase [Bryobacteraceae bacterium]
MLQAATVAIGAFLLFSIQPALAKLLLPVFGGASSVWTVCLLFFQSLLLGGYVYAHWTRPRWHKALAVLSLAALPMMHAAPSAQAAGTSPTWALMMALGTIIGLPYFVLATTSPLLQRWSNLENPYRLYALSNLASLTALLAYPFLIEPWVTLRVQLYAWSAMYAVFVVCLIAASPRQYKVLESGDGAVSPRDFASWTLLAAAGSGLLVATTNQMCQEIASFPFLWVIPLVLYLLSFTLCFDHPRRYDPRAYALFASVAIPVTSALWVVGANFNLWLLLAVYAITLFVCLMLVHGELARTRPAASNLTRFYIAVALGGALGGIFVGLLAPLLFRTYAEFPILLALCAAATLLQRWRTGQIVSLWTMPPLLRAASTGLAFSAVVPLLMFDTGSSGVIDQRRNFYGVLRVTEKNDEQGRRRMLTHGATTHGFQFLEASRRRTPTSYFGWASGVGLALENHPRREAGPLRVGIIGLGAGTLARYARPGDRFRFYEINPDVIAMSSQHFTYAAQAQSPPEILAGDARLLLAAEPPQNYDLFVVDAFTSDAIPTHLLTAECAVLYKRHLAPGGHLLIHISNRALDLEPVIRGLARSIGFNARRIDSPADPSQGAYAATWMHLTPGGTPSTGREIRWTDDFASLWPILRR